MKIKPKFVVVVPKEKATGNKAPAITTSVTYNKSVDELSDKDRKLAIEEAKSLSRLGDSKKWLFEIK